MNFVGCDGQWSVADGVVSCTGTVYTYTTAEMAQMFNGVSAATGLSLAQIVEYGIYYGLSYWVVIFIYKQIAKVIDL